MIDGDTLAKLMAAQIPARTPMTDIVAACSVIVCYALSGMSPEDREAVMDAAGQFIWDTLQKQDKHSAELRAAPPWGSA